MKKCILSCAAAIFLFACNEAKEKTEGKMEDAKMTSSATPTDLPYTASYSSSWSSDVSDADLKTVLMSYKNWETGDMAGLATRFADSVEVDMSSGQHMHDANADLMKYWGTYRDSLSAVRVDMQGWNKMYSTDKKDGYIVTWYKEYDTYKNGKVDSAAFHDINQLKDGKIVWYSQYRRPL
jgi:ketosteroid isomerase-like protein